MNGQKQGHEGAEMDILFIAGGIVLAIGVIYWFFQDQIIHAIFWVKYFELRLVGLFSPSYDELARWVHNTPASKVDFYTVIYLAKDLGAALRFPCAAVTLILAAIIFFFHSEKSFRDIESMTTLSEKMRKPFPSIQVVHGLNLAKTPIDKGPFAMAMTPIEFGKAHKLIYRDKESGEVHLHEQRAKMLFSTQLGRRWQGVDNLSAPERAMFGILASFINYNRSGADDVLMEIASGVTQDKLKQNKVDFGPAEALVKRFAASDDVKKIIDKHAFVNTIFTEMLTQARSTGIVANSNFLWLKVLDRRLWYVLGNVGRKAVFVEAAAVHAHWLAETKLGYAIAQPMVDEAVEGMNIAIQTRVIKDL